MPFEDHFNQNKIFPTENAKVLKDENVFIRADK